MAVGRIPDSFLDDLRARLPVSQVVGRRLELKRAGSEWKCLSPFNKEKTPSFTVNDHKAIWSDFSSGKSGDIFAFEMAITGSTFLQAVESLAQLAGVPLPGSSAPQTAKRSVNGGAGEPTTRGKREIVSTYPYYDRDGALLYEVCRQEWAEGGKRKKSFLQRRHAEGDGGGWVWGLDADTFVKGQSGDWFRLTDARESWPGPRLEVPDEIAHCLYRWPQVREELAQEPDEQRVIWSPEGEKDCETLAAWGLIATDSSGGSKKWSPHHAEELRGADVVILMDNDRSGREYGHGKAASLRGIARRIRVVDWREHWSDAPDGCDVTDWRDHASGNADRLFAIIDKLPAWSPAPPESSFNAIRFLELDKPGREHEWLVKGILTRGEVSIWYGPPACGKSFLVTDAGLSIARGVSWMGLRVRPGLVVYQAGEGGLGLKKRLRAYRMVHKIRLDDDLPFVLLPSPVNLYANDADTEKLIAEIQAWANFYDAPLELVVIDTFSAATPGADEIRGQDVSLVLARCRRISRETGAHVALVHHTTKEGSSPRGHGSLTGNVENAVEVFRTGELDTEQLDDRRILRDVREFAVRKQKDGEEGLARKFILRQVRLGFDIDQEPETSCIIADPEGVRSGATRVREIPRGFVDLAGNNLVLMKALVKAIARKGRRPPDTIPVPAGLSAVTVGDWQDALVEMSFTADPDDPDSRRLKARCKKAVERTYLTHGWSDSNGRNLILKEREWIWRSTRKVMGIDEAPAKPKPPPAPLLAPGETLADLTM
jgi:hypothetical protein